MHRILLRTIVIDVPSNVHDAARDFWTTALAASARRGTVYPEYHVLEQAAVPGTVMVQNVGSAGARVHLDIETDDVEAEVGRLLAAGATEVERHKDWVVLSDPAGLLFCVVPAEAADFAEKATAVGS
ncbi:MAG TPA: VOC family protein [Jatrophihabitantaceae bacterium]|nr:VOC family protein [Jatrophihabitantaceae bacterium]